MGDFLKYIKKIFNENSLFSEQKSKMQLGKGSKNDKKNKDGGQKEKKGKLWAIVKKITDVFVGQTGKETTQNKDSLNPSKKQKENKNQVNNNEPAAPKMSQPGNKGPSKKQKENKKNKKQVNNNEPAAPITSQPGNKGPSKKQKEI